MDYVIWWLLKDLDSLDSLLWINCHKAESERLFGDWEKVIWRLGTQIRLKGIINRGDG